MLQTRLCQGANWCTQTRNHGTTAAVVPPSRGKGSCFLTLPPHTTSRTRATLFGTPDYQTLLDQRTSLLVPQQVDAAKAAMFAALSPLLEGAWDLQWRVPSHQDPELHLAHQGQEEEEERRPPKLLPSIVKCLEQAGLQEVRRLSGWAVQCTSADRVRVVVKVSCWEGVINTGCRSLHAQG